MADFQTRIVYFHATGTLAAGNVNNGMYLAAVPSAAAGATYAADPGNIARVRADYGAGEIRTSAALVTIPRTPRIALPGAAWYNSATGTLQLTPVVRFPARESVRALHERYEELYVLLHRLGYAYPPDDVLALDRLLFALHGGVYVVFHDEDLDNTERVSWLQAQALGPSDEAYDADDPKTIAPIIDAIAVSARITTGAMFLASPGPDVRNTFSALGTRLSLAQTFMETNQYTPRPTVAQLRGGAWIEGIMY